VGGGVWRRLKFIVEVVLVRNKSEKEESVVAFFFLLNEFLEMFQSKVLDVITWLEWLGARNFLFL